MAVTVVVEHEMGRVHDDRVMEEVANFVTDNEFADAPKNGALIEQKAMELRQLLRRAGIMKKIDAVTLYFD